QRKQRAFAQAAQANFRAGAQIVVGLILAAEDRRFEIVDARDACEGLRQFRDLAGFANADLTLERIGYILFGEVSHVILADITIETLPTAIDIIRSMIMSVRAKGQGAGPLEESRRVRHQARWWQLRHARL
ncbi:MAG: hypothetical protein HGA45_03800, partial [Chloroflexales bacterium]|nr:hypothetical protein [Chloroflexales bacterium]